MYRSFIGLVLFVFLFVQNSFLLAPAGAANTARPSASDEVENAPLVGRIESKAAPHASSVKATGVRRSGHGHRRVRRVFVVRRYVKPGEITSRNTQAHKCNPDCVACCGKKTLAGGKNLNHSGSIGGSSLGSESGLPADKLASEPTECEHKKLLGASLGADGKCTAACELCKTEGCEFTAQGICKDCPKCFDHKKAEDKKDECICGADCAKKKTIAAVPVVAKRGVESGNSGGSGIPTIVQYIEVPAGTAVPGREFTVLAAGGPQRSGDIEVVPVNVVGNRIGTGGRSSDQIEGRPGTFVPTAAYMPAGSGGGSSYSGSGKKRGLAGEVEGPASSRVGGVGVGGYPISSGSGSGPSGYGGAPNAGGLPLAAAESGVNTLPPVSATAPAPLPTAEESTPAAPVVVTGGVPMPTPDPGVSPNLAAPIPVTGNQGSPSGAAVAPVPSSSSSRGSGGFAFPTGLATTIGGLALAGGLITGLVLLGTMGGNGGGNNYGFFPYFPPSVSPISAPIVAANPGLYAAPVIASNGGSGSGSSGTGSGGGYGGGSGGGSCGSGSGGGYGGGSGGGSCSTGSGGGYGGGSGGGSCGTGGSGGGYGGGSGGGSCGTGGSGGGYGGGSCNNGGYGSGSCNNGGGWQNWNGNGGYGNGYGGGYGGANGGAYGSGGNGRRQGNYSKYGYLPATATSCVNLNVATDSGCTSIMNCGPIGFGGFGGPVGYDGGFMPYDGGGYNDCPPAPIGGGYDDGGYVPYDGGGYNDCPPAPIGGDSGGYDPYSYHGGY